MAEGLAVFQFLIGRLKTVLGLEKIGEAMMFQFLIGRLKTIFCSSVYCLPFLFQFLIGRLKTMQHFIGIQNKASFNSS